MHVSIIYNYIYYTSQTYIHTQRFMALFHVYQGESVPDIHYAMNMIPTALQQHTTVLGCPEIQMGFTISISRRQLGAPMGLNPHTSYICLGLYIFWKF